MKKSIAELEVPEDEDDLLEDGNLIEPDLLDADVKEFISYVMAHIEDELDILQGCLPGDSDSSIFEDQRQSCGIDSTGSNFDDSLHNLDNLQIDHNCSLYLDPSVMESMLADMTEEDLSIELEPWMYLEGTTVAAEQNSTFPVVANADGAGSQLVPQDVTQSTLPELTLTEEDSRLLENIAAALATCLPEPRGEEQPLTKGRGTSIRKMWNKKSSMEINHKMDNLEERSLLEQLWELQVLVAQQTTQTPTVETCSMVNDFSPSVCEGLCCSCNGTALPPHSLFQLPLSLESSDAAGAQSDVLADQQLLKPGSI